MKAIIIAAGMSKRLRPLTKNLPKCLLPFKGKTLLQTLVDHFKSCGIHDISIIRGYLAEKIEIPGATYFYNSDYQVNNVLHSLISARLKIDEAVLGNEHILVSYADIWFDYGLLKEVMHANADIIVSVDPEWRRTYAARPDNPVSTAELCVFEPNGRVKKIGKGIDPDDVSQHAAITGEVVGLYRFSPKGARRFLDYFADVDSRLKLLTPFQTALEWRKAYITDLLAYMVQQGEVLTAVPTRHRWIEFDTVQDYLRYESEHHQA